MDKPFAACKSNEPYVYYPGIAEPHAQGINIWYDEGSSAGRNWRAAIGDSLLSSNRALS